jgi:hypothetical protein
MIREWLYTRCLDHHWLAGNDELNFLVQAVPAQEVEIIV